MSDTLESSGATTISASELFGAQAQEASQKPEPEQQAQGETQENENSEAQTKESAEKEPKEKEENVGEEEDQEQDSSDEDGEESEEGDDESRRAKKKRGVQKRIDKLSQRAKKAQQEAEYWRDLAMKNQSQDKGENQNAEQQPHKEPTNQQALDRPNPDNFETQAEYIEALTDWKLDQKLKAKEQQDNQTKQRTEFEQKAVSYNKRAEEFKKQHADFDDVIAEIDDVFIPNAVLDTVMSSEDGPALIYELAQDPDEFKRMCAMPPEKAAIELGKAMAQLELKKTKVQTKPPQTTKAPPPPNPVGSKNETRRRVDDPNVSTLEFFKLRNEEENQKRKGYF